MSENRTQLEEALRHCRTGFWSAGFFSLVINVLALTGSIYMLQVYDRVLPGRSIDTLIYLTILAGGVLAVMGLLEVVRSRILTSLGTWLDRSVSSAVFARSLDNALRGQSYKTEALRDLATIRSYLSGTGVLALFDAPWAPIYLAIIFLLHPLLGVLALGGAVALFVLALLNHVLTAKTLKEANGASAQGYQGAEAAYRNAEVIDGMGMGLALMRRWEQVNSGVLQLQARASDRAGLLSAASKSMRSFLQIAVLALGAWLVLANELSSGSMIAASIIMSRTLSPVEQAIGSWKQTTGARDAWMRLKALFQAEPLHPATMDLPRPAGNLTIENVVYTPAGAQQPVLRNVSLSLSAGKVLAIIGASAAGKSTLARLIVGLGKPQHGSIRLDGGDVFAWNRESFGQHVGYLPQDVELFPGTVRENIARMEAGDPDDVVAAAKMAGVHDMILRLPKGYETEIGDKAAILSGGQRQRIGLARALYKRPVLLVLDEPNSSLDTRGEERLNEAIAAAKASGSTVVLVSHRPTLMTHVDQILVLKEGQVHMAGPRDTVLSELRKLQSSAEKTSMRVVATE